MAEATVTIGQCPPATTCPPPPPPPVCKPEVHYVGAMPHWCQDQVCTSGEIFGFIFFLGMFLVVVLGARLLYVGFRDALLKESLDTRKGEAKLDADRMAAKRADAREIFQLEKERLDMQHADRIREGQRQLDMKKAELEAIGYVSPPKP